MRVLLALSVIGPLCILVAYAIRTRTRAERSPSHELITAVRLLDRVSEADDVMPYLPTNTREEVRAFLHRYHGKEINR